MCHFETLAHLGFQREAPAGEWQLSAMKSHSRRDMVIGRKLLLSDTRENRESGFSMAASVQLAVRLLIMFFRHIQICKAF